MHKDRDSNSSCSPLFLPSPFSDRKLISVRCCHQIPTIDSLYGAMLAGTDYVIMGAGIPMEVPGILDRLAEQEATQLVIDVDGSEETYHMKFDPLAFWSLSVSLWISLSLSLCLHLSLSISLSVQMICFHWSNNDSLSRMHVNCRSLFPEHTLGLTI